MDFRHLLPLVAGIVGSAAVLSVHAGPIAAYVVAIEGRWSAHGTGTPLVVGSPLPPMARLAPLGATPRHRIAVVAARGGALVLTVDCAKPRACDRPITVQTPDGAGDSDSQDSWLQRLMARIEGKPERYVATLSRSGGAPMESVLAATGDEVDIAPALRPVPPGRYTVSLHPLECRPPCAPLDADAPLNWSQGARVALSLPGMRPGLHDLVLGRPGAAAVQPTRSARVLVLPKDEARAAASRLDEWTARVDSWRPALDPAQRQSLMRAALDELAAVR
ncbi:hypothetical protein [Piscinibacter sp. XHJ-5]|uniref:hypothetical protein n=1 Tax=Piscinibacter sp. XHJ-5 TaxID=3037797 RepID=UPI0024533A8D|nr:hypothetical protein [Piscinibacter sp. XHJ-5]